MLESIARRPAVKRPHRGRLGRRRVVPFAEGGGGIAIILQHLGDGGRGLGDHPHVPVPIHRPLGDGAGPDPMLVAARQQRGAGGRADRGGVEGIVGDALAGEFGQRGRADVAAKGVGLTEAHIVQKDDQDVGRIGGQVVGFRAPLVNGSRQRRPCRAGRRHRRERQDRTIGRLGTSALRQCEDQSRRDDGQEARNAIWHKPSPWRGVFAAH